MAHKQDRRSSLTANTTEQLFQYLDDFKDQLDRIESMIAGSQRFAYAVAKSEYRRDRTTMAEFTNLIAEVSKIRDLTASIKAMNDGLKAERDALKTELDALKAADAVDQAAVDEAQAKLAEVTAALEALTAVVSNTPVGGSMRDVPV